MTVGIFRSRIFAAGRAFLRDGRGVSAVETAFAFLHHCGICQYGAHDSGW